ncbi:hypothetical protein L6R53_06125 [Myxococcota bacterium]|nr:hypothetical protein [Myxococcota bacterium]
MTLTLPLRAARTPSDPGDTTGPGGAIAGDSLCRVEQTPHDGGDTALLAELAALIPPLGESSIVHGSTSLCTQTRSMAGMGPTTSPDMKEMTTSMQGPVRIRCVRGQGRTW